MLTYFNCYMYSLSADPWGLFCFILFGWGGFFFVCLFVFVENVVNRHMILIVLPDQMI